MGPSLSLSSIATAFQKPLRQTKESTGLGSLAPPSYLAFSPKSSRMKEEAEGRDLGGRAREGPEPGAGGPGADVPRKGARFAGSPGRWASSERQPQAPVGGTEALELLPSLPSSTWSQQVSRAAADPELGLTTANVSQFQEISENVATSEPNVCPRQWGHPTQPRAPERTTGCWRTDDGRSSHPGLKTLGPR